MGDIAVTGEVRLGAVLEKSGAIFGGRIVPIILVTFVAQIPNDLAQFLAATAGPDDCLALTVLSGVVGTATGGLSTGAVMYGSSAAAYFRRANPSVVSWAAWDPWSASRCSWE